MAKNKRNQKEKEQENPNPSLSSPNQSGLVGQEVQLEAVTGTPAPSIATANEEVGDKVQVGQLEQAQQQEEETRAIHPQLGTVFESNVTKYKGRKTEFLTLPMKLTVQQKYMFKGAGKQKAKITLLDDGSKLIVERA